MTANGRTVFSPCRVRTTYWSLFIRERKKEGERERFIDRYSRPALMWIERPALLSVAESTPENCSILEATRAFHGRTNDAHPHSTFYLRSACSIAWQRSLNRRSRKGRTDFSVRWKYSAHDFVQLKRYNDAKWRRNLTDKIFDFFSTNKLINFGF